MKNREIQGKRIRRRHSLPVYLLMGLMLAGISAGGCRDAVGPESDEAENPLPVQAVSGMTDAITAMMEDAIQDEYHAEMIYRKVLATFGQVRPFSNIVNAEVRHAASLASLFTRYGLEVPESVWSMENVPAFDTLKEACDAAVTAEVENIELYDEYLEQALPEDVRIVFENNRRASLYGHLPAFKRCAGR